MKKDALARTVWETGFGRAYVMDEEYGLKLISFVIVDILSTSFMYVKIRDAIKYDLNMRSTGRVINFYSPA
jgi:hypothetical protein